MMILKHLQYNSHSFFIFFSCASRSRISCFFQVSSFEYFAVCALKTKFLANEVWKRKWKVKKKSKHLKAGFIGILKWLNLNKSIRAQNTVPCPSFCILSFTWQQVNCAQKQKCFQLQFEIKRKKNEFEYYDNFWVIKYFTFLLRRFFFSIIVLA